MPAGPAAVAVAAVTAAAQDDLLAAARAQVQAGRSVHTHPGTTEVLDAIVPARHTVVAPPSSARCRARYGRSSFPASQTAAAPTFFGIERVVPRHANSAGMPGTVRAHSVARACLAALQGGQAGASPNQDQDEQAGTGLLNLLRIKTAISPANRGGS